MMHCSRSDRPGAAADLETAPSPDTEPRYPPSNRTASELPTTGQTDRTLEPPSPSAGGTGSTQNQEFDTVGEPGGNPVGEQGGNPGREPEGEPAGDSGGEPGGEQSKNMSEWIRGQTDKSSIKHQIINQKSQIITSCLVSGEQICFWRVTFHKPSENQKRTNREPIENQQRTKREPTQNQ